MAAVYMINRFPSSVLQGRSPYEIFHNSAPSLYHLRTMGCLCFVTATDNPDKFSLRAIAAVHMRYSTSQKGYRLYNLKDKKLFVSRDVIFREDIFPFQLLKKGRDPPLFLDPVKQYIQVPITKKICLMMLMTRTKCKLFLNSFNI